MRQLLRNVVSSGQVLEKAFLSSFPRTRVWLLCTEVHHAQRKQWTQSKWHPEWTQVVVFWFFLLFFNENFTLELRFLRWIRPCKPTVCFSCSIFLNNLHHDLVISRRKENNSNTGRILGCADHTANESGPVVFEWD